ncbi:M14 family zinc carboxypeptidase [Microbacterium sp. LWH12-1.2]|uniref:M14 family zinc carboxypeptidase n=1 Tax=Microbacterium sp. LWH12-1.2 TaxID=3135259 RepID=UPI003435A597
MAAFRCTVPATPANLLVVAQLDTDGSIAADHRMVVGGELHLVLTDAEIGIVETLGLPVTRVSELQVRDLRDDVGGGLADIATGFVSGYLDGPGVAAAITALAAAHPTLCALTTLPEATLGYDGSLASAAGPASVQLLRITTTPASKSKPGILLIGGTHAREWMNPLIAIEFAAQLLNNYDPASVDPEVQAITALVDGLDILIVPVLNPDGLTFSVHDDAGWRKNRRNNGGGCFGVDNNRNYEVYFGGAGSSGASCNDTFRGAFAFSEAENRNIRWVLEQFPNVLVGVDAHSYGEQILRPNPAGGSFVASEPVSAADEAIYAGLETTLRTAIQSVNGNAYSLGTTSNHAGPSDEYMFFAHRVFGFNTECGLDFQPPWAQATPVIAEVTTGLRALAEATRTLTVTTPAPLSVVQCIDRTGSMVAFGYESAARQNAKRFIDLLSLGDRTAVVSFADPAPGVTPPADRARVEAPLTPLDDPGDAATMRAAVDGIAFGGWTPIGAGIIASAGELTGAAPPRAVLLVSDGFQNVDPTVATALAALPAGLRVYTVALGPAADAPLLQSIATSTGGLFLNSPTALDLHLAYNDMRAGLTDQGLVVNRIDSAPMIDIPVEPDADELTVSVSTPSGTLGRVVLISPSGRAVRVDDWGVRMSGGDGYVNITVLRPAVGIWRLLRGARGDRGDRGQRFARPVASAVAAFVRSPLRLKLRLPDVLKEGQPSTLEVRARFEKHPLTAPRVSVASVAHPRLLLPENLDPDRESEKLQGILAKHARLRPRHLTWDGTTAVLPPGFSSVSIRIEGRLPGGSPFVRVVRRSVRVV